MMRNSSQAVMGLTLLTLLGACGIEGDEPRPERECPFDNISACWPHLSVGASGGSVGDSVKIVVTANAGAFAKESTRFSIQSSYSPISISLEDYMEDDDFPIHLEYDTAFLITEELQFGQFSIGASISNGHGSKSQSASYSIAPYVIKEVRLEKAALGSMKIRIDYSVNHFTLIDRLMVNVRAKPTTQGLERLDRRYKENDIGHSYDWDVEIEPASSNHQVGEYTLSRRIAVPPDFEINLQA